MKRLFFALWPDDNTRQQCIKISNALRTEKSLPVQAANIHVTLVFLGNIDSAKEAAFKQMLATVPVPTITLCFNQLSFWKKPGILCLTTSRVSPELTGLVETLSKLARILNIPIDQRPFKPHVSLVKKVKKVNGLTSLEFDPVIWHARSFCLVESCSLLNGVEYRILEEWKENPPQTQK